MFDKVFNHEAQQQDVYTATAQPLLQGLFDGFNATVFAYGVRRFLFCKRILNADIAIGHWMRQDTHYQWDRR